MTGNQKNERDQGPGSPDSSEPQHSGQRGASGTGAASAFALMQSLRERQARQKPADDHHAEDQRGPAR